MKTALILGAGPAGCAAAHQIRLNLPDWRVILIEKSLQIGAGARTEFYAGHPYTFGPRHFLTKNEAAWEYMNKYCPLNDCGDHEFKSFVAADNAFYNFPIHEDDIKRMLESASIVEERRSSVPPIMPHCDNLEEYWLNSVGRTLYNKLIGPYNEKMWQMPARELDTFNWSPKGAMIKSGPRAAWSDAHSGYPKSPNGYNEWFDICAEGCEVITNSMIKYNDIWKESTGHKDYNFLIDHGNYGSWSAIYCDVIINTISLDNLCDSREIGMLPYIGRDFYKFVLPIEFALPPHVYFIYESGAEKWTRITEYKKFTRHKSPHTLLSMEIPSGNGRHYPIPTLAAQAKAKQYIDLLPKNVYTIGRHGTYRYAVDIAACIEMSMALVERIKGGWDHPVPLERFR